MSAFPQFNRLKQCRHGMMLYNTNDVYIGQSLERYGEFSEGESYLFEQIVKPGQLVLEVGANIGCHTVHLAELAGPTGTVIAFEPQRIVFQTLCANMALNSRTNVHCHQAAVGKAPGHITVPRLDYASSNNFGGLELGRQGDGELVPLLTIDGMDLPRCDFIKIDVEGMEKDVVEGAARTIARFKPLLYVENDRREKSNALIWYLDSLGYSMYWHGPPLFSPSNFAGNQNNVFGTIVSINMVCVPKNSDFQMTGFQPVIA